MDAAQRSRVLEVLARAADMTVATIREDGYPQATAVGFVHDGMKLYFGAAAASQKARNLARDPKVSVSITLPYRNWEEIEGLSAGGLATRLEDPAEMRRVRELMQAKYPELAAYVPLDATAEDLALFRIDPEAVSLLDYRKGFGHVEQIEVGRR